MNHRPTPKAGDNPDPPQGRTTRRGRCTQKGTQTFKRMLSDGTDTSNDSGQPSELATRGIIVPVRAEVRVGHGWEARSASRTLWRSSRTVDVPWEAGQPAASAKTRTRETKMEYLRMSRRSWITQNENVPSCRTRIKRFVREQRRGGREGLRLDAQGRGLLEGPPSVSTRVTARKRSLEEAR